MWNAAWTSQKKTTKEYGIVNKAAFLIRILQK